MGVIRKTASIATLGIIDFRSKKEVVRRAEKAKRAASIELTQEQKAREVADKRVADAERRARVAELTALQAAKRSGKERQKRRQRRREAASGAMDHLEGLVSSAQPVVEAQVKELGRRGRKAAKKASKRAEKAQDEARQLGRRGRKKATKAVKRAEKEARDMSTKAKVKLDEVTEAASAALSD